MTNKKKSKQTYLPPPGARDAGSTVRWPLGAVATDPSTEPTLIRDSITGQCDQFVLTRRKARHDSYQAEKLDEPTAAMCQMGHRTLVSGRAPRIRRDQLVRQPSRSWRGFVPGAMIRLLRLAGASLQNGSYSDEDLDRDHNSIQLCRKKFPVAQRIQGLTRTRAHLRRDLDC